MKALASIKQMILTPAFIWDPGHVRNPACMYCIRGCAAMQQFTARKKMLTWTAKNRNDNNTLPTNWSEYCKWAELIASYLETRSDETSADGSRVSADRPLIHADGITCIRILLEGGYYKYIRSVPVVRLTTNGLRGRGSLFRPRLFARFVQNRW